MDTLIFISARALMGMSLGFHILFTAVGIGIPLFLVLAEGIWLRTGDETYRLMARSQPEKFAAMEAHFETERGRRCASGASRTRAWE